MKNHGFIAFIKGLFKSCGSDNISFLSAALAYYTTFSLAPLIIICIAIASIFLEKEVVQNDFLNQIYNTLGSGSKELVKSMIDKTTNPHTSIISQIIGVILLIFGASYVFAALQTGLNAIWHVRPKPDLGIWAIIKARFLSFTMVLGVGFLLLVSLVITVIIAAASNLLNNYFSGGEIISILLNLVVSVGIITVLFAMMFKFLPDVKIRWRDVWVGAFTTTVLFILGKFLLGIYLRYSHTGSEFGAAASLIIILVWVYYSAQIFFLGAEFTKAFATRGGRDIVPTKNAEIFMPLGDIDRPKEK